MAHICHDIKDQLKPSREQTCFCTHCTGSTDVHHNATRHQDGYSSIDCIGLQHITCRLDTTNLFLFSSSILSFLLYFLLIASVVVSTSGRILKYVQGLGGSFHQLLGLGLVVLFATVEDVISKESLEKKGVAMKVVAGIGRARAAQSRANSFCRQRGLSVCLFNPWDKIAIYSHPHASLSHSILVIYLPFFPLFI